MSTNKSFSSETSERYSRALFEVAKESNQLDNIENDIRNFKLLLSSSVEISNFLKDPTQSLSTQNNFVALLAEKIGFSKNLKNFFLLLIIKRRIFFINKIIESFLRLCSKERGELKASLISAKKLSQKEIDELSSDFSKFTGSNIKFDYKLDEKLIGGLKLQLGSFMIDTSIKNKLKKYEQKMLEE